MPFEFHLKTLDVLDPLVRFSDQFRRVKKPELPRPRNQFFAVFFAPLPISPVDFNLEFAVVVLEADKTKLSAA